jgi:hypothetical protein
MEDSRPYFLKMPYRARSAMAAMLALGAGMLTFEYAVTAGTVFRSSLIIAVAAVVLGRETLNAFFPRCSTDTLGISVRFTRIRWDQLASASVREKQVMFFHVRDLDLTWRKAKGGPVLKTTIAVGDLAEPDALLAEVGTWVKIT